MIGIHNFDKPTIGIAGFGFVGQAVYASIKTECNVVVYDKYKPKFSNIKNIGGSITILVCLPTPMDLETGSQNISELHEFLSQLADIKYEGIVIIKSTVFFENIVKWSFKLNLVLNPEFLNQNSAPDDFANQNMVLLGGSASHTCEVRKIYKTCFNLPEDTNYQLVSATEACHFKYMHNIYHAYQVLFWNYVQQKTGNSRKYVMLYEMLYGRKPILNQIALDGQLGYGGACFPKDVNAMQFESPHLLTEFMCRFNAELRPNVEATNGPVNIECSKKKITQY